MQDYVKNELLEYFPEFSQRDTLSDNGNVLADLRGKILEEPIKFEKIVNGIEGVVEVGIFALDKPNLAIIGLENGYGLMVEINHSDGYITRYAHNKENIAELGSVVKKGEVIAKMGTSGRSTGPHVHFEVYKNGRVVDPASYIRRTSR